MSSDAEDKMGDYGSARRGLEIIELSQSEISEVRGRMDRGRMDRGSVV